MIGTNLGKKRLVLLALANGAPHKNTAAHISGRHALAGRTARIHKMHCNNILVIKVADILICIFINTTTEGYETVYA